MPRRCIINNCLTKGCISNKSMYKFPKDEELCKKWLEVIDNPKLNKLFEEEGVLPLNKRVFVCSDHFEDKWFREVNEPCQGLFLGAIPSVNLNLSMESLLTNLRKQEMCKEIRYSKKVINKQINLTKSQVQKVGTSVYLNQNVGFMVEAPVEQSSTAVTSDADNIVITNLDAPLDTLSVKDENLLQLIKRKKMNEKTENLPKRKVYKTRITPFNSGRIKKERTRKSKVKKLKLRVKGSEKFMNIVVAPKSDDANRLSSQSLQKTIKIFVPKQNNGKSAPIKVVVPNTIDGKEVQLDRSEISKIINLVSGPRVVKSKPRKCFETQNYIPQRSTDYIDSDDPDNCDVYEKPKQANDVDNEEIKTKCKAKEVKATGKCNKSNHQLKNLPLKSVCKKTPEANKTMRDFIESYFGEMIKCSCDFTPPENIINISQRIIDLKKKLGNAQKLLSKHKVNNRKISAAIEELRKQIPEKPVKTQQKGQLIKCIIPRNKVNEKYSRGKHRFTKSLKSFALDLYYSSPLSYSILEKIYLLPSRKTLKRWLVHPQYNASDMAQYRQEDCSLPEYSPHLMDGNLQLLDNNIQVLDGGMGVIVRHQDMLERHNLVEPLVPNMSVIDDNIETLQENHYEMIFRNDLTEAIMNT